MVLQETMVTGQADLGALLDEPVPALDVDVFLLARPAPHAVPGTLHRVRRVRRQVLQDLLPVARVLQEALLRQHRLRDHHPRGVSQPRMAIQVSP